MRKEDFDEWREGEITQQVMKYWKDSAEDEAEYLKQQLLGGGLLTEAEQIKISTIYATLERIAEIEFEDIELFYKGDSNEGTRQ